MKGLPSGTVTFLFTDVEGSTKLWEKYPAAMRLALARHDAVASGIIEKNDGVLVKSRGEGDSLFAVFGRATDAVAAACSLQLAIASEPWPPEVPLKVRMALHAGEADLRGGDYYGSAVNRCARLRATAYGAQTILSLSTEELVRDSLPEAVSLRDLGLHRLRDLQRPEQVFQVEHPALPSEFPPLKSLDSFPNNLPVHLTSYVGRDAVIAEVIQLLHQNRLLTLCGTGGAGKTRLSLQVGAEVLDDYSDGVWFVELAPLTDPLLLPHTVAATLGVREQASRTPIQTIEDYLKPKSVLMILDNCEHLIEAAAQLANALLRSCPGLRILASSREGLDIAGEQTYPLRSLSLPDPTHPHTVETLGQYEAVQLFIERAVLSDPAFAVTNQNAPAVAQICHRLDGMPLAIELAAARVKAMPVEQIALRLHDRFRLLTGGSRTAMPHHRTLRALIDWSADLLSDAERALLRRLAVFVGGWTPDAAVAVGAADGIEDWEVLDLLTQLVDKSLVVYDRQIGSVRYRLLETIRHYALDRLAESGEQDAARGRHQRFFHGLAAEAEENLTGEHQAAWLERLDVDNGNLRAAFEWFGPDPESARSALRMAGSLWRFWYVRGYLNEGRDRLSGVLAGEGAAERTALRAKVLNAAGILAWDHGDLGGARSLYEESLVLRREVGDRVGEALTLNNLGIVSRDQGERESAQSFHLESLTILRDLGDSRGVGGVLLNLGLLAKEQQDHDSARELYGEALEIFKGLGDRWSMGASLHNLGEVLSLGGDPASALLMQEESLTIRRELGDKQGMAASLGALGDLARARGELDTAHALLQESLAIRIDLGSPKGIVESLEAFAALALAYGRPAPAARLFGASEALRRSIGTPLTPVERVELDRRLAAVRTGLDEHGFRTAWDEGLSLTMEKAAAHALSEVAPDSS